MSEPTVAPSLADLRAELFERVRDPRAVPVLMRHAIPVIGVFVFDWSPLEAMAALLLDALSTLWMVAGVGAYFAVRDTTNKRAAGGRAVLRFWGQVVLTFGIVGALLSLFVIVPAFFLLPLAESANLDPSTIVTSGWLPRAFAAMLACQLPGLVRRIRDAEASGLSPEKMGMDSEVGFVAHRTVMLAFFASMLGIFGRYALHAVVLVAQVFGACTEIMPDRYMALIAGPRAALSSSSRRSRSRSRRGARGAGRKRRPTSDSP